MPAKRLPDMIMQWPEHARQSTRRLASRLASRLVRWPGCWFTKEPAHAVPAQGGWSCAAVNGTACRRRLAVLCTMLALGMLTHSAWAADESSTPIIAMNTTDTGLAKQLRQALAAQSEAYIPRTEHLLADGSPKYLNRLILEDSPYLLQHAHNPVNWYPWGDAAFRQARKQNKPVFLSIGYATCHWCHVMERESFEDEAIAQLMNQHFIAIKVDREQLPDVDAMYMNAVMLINGSGGWPMSSFLDSEGRPFFGATYFPPDRFRQLLERVHQLWQEEPDRLLEQATLVLRELDRLHATNDRAQNVGLTQIRRALSQIQASFDPEHGGFGQAPKFPQEATLTFLLDQATRALSAPASPASNAATTPDSSTDPALAKPSALHMAILALEKMARGGIHDHVGGGFHRYTVDSRWQVPHFEKMLYNQAALARNYSQAFALTKNTEHHRTATRLLDYVLRDMRSPAGLFYSATDADSEGEEGRFFIWTPEQLIEALGETDAALAARVWNVTGEGNFEGTSILHTEQTNTELAAALSMSPAALQANIDRWAETLRQQRDRREHPLRDEKIIASWNGMMITALAESAGTLARPDYLDAARQAGDALWDTLVQPDQSLRRTAYRGRASIPATQADYAYLAEAALALYDATGEALWLNRASKLMDAQHEKFWDPEQGGYFMGAPVVAGATLGSRPKDITDNNMASGNAVALRVLGRLFKRTGEPRHESQADELIAALSGRINQTPAAFNYLLTGVAEHLYGEMGYVQYGGRGAVRAIARRHLDTVTVSIALKDGWHINSDRPLQDYLVPTQLSDLNGTLLSQVQYPEAQVRTLDFQQAQLSLFEGRIDINASLPVTPENTSRLNTLNLHLQACNDERCLAPEKLSLVINEPAR